MEIYEKQSVHYQPHIHRSMECIYVTRGTLELGIEENFQHMETGDFGIVFPNVIHHYQVFCREESGPTIFCRPLPMPGPGRSRCFNVSRRFRWFRLRRCTRIFPMPWSG